MTRSELINTVAAFLPVVEEEDPTTGWPTGMFKPDKKTARTIVGALLKLGVLAADDVSVADQQEEKG